MSARHHALAYVTCLVLTAGARAQGAEREFGPGDKVWNAWVVKAIESVQDSFESERNKDLPARRDADAEARKTNYVAVREPALQPETSASSLERLTAAFNTDVADAEAGVSVAPFLLFRPTNEAGRALDGLSFSVATLKGGKTRVGGKFAWSSSAEPPDSLGDIALEPCKLDEQKLGQNLLDLRSDFDLACSALVRLFTEPPKEERPTDPDELSLWQQALAACGASESPPPPTLINARNSLVTALKNAARRGTARARREVASLTVSLELIDPNKNRLPLATGCYDATQLKQAYRRAQWERTTWRFGISSTAEYFPRKTGFNPDEPAKNLPRGQNSAWSIQAEASIEKKGINVVGSLAWGRSRSAFDDKLYKSWKPAFSLSLPVARLDGQPIQSARQG